MRGHGAVVVGPSIQRVVGRSIFLPLNATLQMQAAALGGPVTYLDPQEAKKIEEREGYGLGRAWDAWKRKAMAKHLEGGGK
jgi:HCOMODA/2-hydroxy-3-carboxy-muconic semialdehyde decarboxylase